MNSDLSANASYSVSISIVPEPSSLTLAAIGVLWLVVACCHLRAATTVSADPPSANHLRRRV